MAHAIASRIDGFPGFPGALTPREHDVLSWVARGKTNVEIGMILAISPRTVQKHLEHIFEKLGVENRTTAAVYAIAVPAMVRTQCERSIL